MSNQRERLDKIKTLLSQERERINVKLLGEINDSKDLVTKEYVDNKIPGAPEGIQKGASQLYGMASGQTLAGGSNYILLPFTSVYNANSERIHAALTMIGLESSYRYAIHIVSDEVKWIQVNAQMSFGSGATSGSTAYLQLYRDGKNVASLGWERMSGPVGFVNSAGVMLAAQKDQIFQLYGRVTAGTPTLGGGFLTRLTITEL